MCARSVNASACAASVSPAAVSATGKACISRSRNPMSRWRSAWPTARSCSSFAERLSRSSPEMPCRLPVAARPVSVAARCAVMAAMTARTRARGALVAVALALLAGCGGSDDGAKDATAAPSDAEADALRLGPAFGSMTSLPGVLDNPPPWPANRGSLQLRMREIGLDPLPEEGQAVHIHQHLDVFVRGRPVTVPADIGVGPRLAFFADVHTHENGVIHVESPTVRSYSLGQFFAIWGVPLSATCIGSLCERGDRQLRVWVNGKPVSADPTRIVLAEHQQIVIAYGTAEQIPDPVPASFDFASVGL